MAKFLIVISHSFFGMKLLLFETPSGLSQEKKKGVMLVVSEKTCTLHRLYSKRVTFWSVITAVLGYITFPSFLFLLNY